jgi:coenzyme F420 hydrogenase subunit beta
LKHQNNIESTLNAGTCIGCGICASTCGTGALDMVWTSRSEHVPRIDEAACSGCGRCSAVCPNSPPTLRSEAARVSEAAGGWTFGLEAAEYFLAWDPDPGRRVRSASGGALTAVLRRLFSLGLIDAVVHGRPVEGGIGDPHFEAALTFSTDECDSRRGSFYHPICYTEVLRRLPGGVRQVALVGVPCVIRGIRALWKRDPEFRKVSLVTIALACSHNVNGQFIDFLAESAPLPRDVKFEASLRNKDVIADANNFNIQFTAAGRKLWTENRYRSIFTHAWRGYWFAMHACDLCPDFWGAHADISVKDAWGKWAADPLGKSILVLRNSELRHVVTENPELKAEALDKETVAHCQDVTVDYKQLRIRDRLKKPVWSRSNRESGYLRYRMASILSKFLYPKLGAAATRHILLATLGRPHHPVPPEPLASETMTPRLLKRLRRLLAREIRACRQPVVVCWGTGSLGRDIGRALGRRIDYFVDSDPGRQGQALFGRPVLAPSALLDEQPSRLLVVIASMYEEAICRKAGEMGVHTPAVLLPIGAVLAKAKRNRAAEIKTRLGRWWSAIRARFARKQKPRRRGFWKPQQKILVVGGYGYRNAGDEAQLAATLQELRSRFPAYLVKVLTPSLHATYETHEACMVGEAPRVAFYDLDTSGLYSLDTAGKKLRFLLRSLWLLLNARLVRRGIPFSLVSARRTALLYEMATADLVYFCGGGYLTGKTLSRLWDGMFILRIARIFGTPCVLSGQTIGVWNSSFSRKLAGWGLGRAALIATRDGNGSIDALNDLGLTTPRIMTTCDDALFLGDRPGPGQLRGALAASGLDPAIADSRYIVLNIHYWGFAQEPDRAWLIQRTTDLVRRLGAIDPVPIIGLPMIPTDEPALLDLERQVPDSGFRMLRYNTDFRVARALIAGSWACVTMKHHPIIFALGERVPAISLAHSAYYEHKNRGALELVGLGRWSIRLEKDDYLERFEELYRELSADRNSIADAIGKALPPLLERRSRFFGEVSAILQAKN